MQKNQLKKYNPIMLVGTGSDVGKSIIAAGLCRIFKQDGYNPAPFKAQNMALNSYATPEGLEIGRAQAVQAEAAGIPCHVDMNPVLLKPSGNQQSQVIVNGKPVGNQTAREYFQSVNKDQLFTKVQQAFDRLQDRFSPIIMEGAGSISELNLKDRDITNMRMAKYAGAATYLVADIDRGGIFGSVYGTIQLLDEEERKLIKGIIINKFRGDPALFEDGKAKLEEITGVPVIGIIPYAPDIYIEEEDSVAVEQKQHSAHESKVNIAVVLLKRLSNYTDFAALEQDERVHLFYSRHPEEIEKADIIILPGSKNTIADLIDIKNAGIAQIIQKAYKSGKTVIGICGGFQMMGQYIEDPDHVEGEVEYMPGLDLLPIHTKLEKEKVTHQRQFYYRENPESLGTGYEIHMGRTSFPESCKPVATFQENGQKDGLYFNEKCWGSYLHGILDNKPVIDDLLAPYLNEESQSTFDFKTFKEEQYDKLAALMRGNMNIEILINNL